jgi:hypothetical protein
VTKLDKLVPSKPLKHDGGDLEQFNLQLVACVDETSQLKWIGYVTDINLKTSELLISSQHVMEPGSKLVVCDRKLFSV